MLPVVTATDAYRTTTTAIVADSGYHSEANLKTLADQRIDAALSKAMITRRFATVEPVFGNLRGNKRQSQGGRTVEAILPDA